MTKISTPTRYYRYNARGLEGNDQVIRVAANLLKKVTGTNITVVKEMLSNNYQSHNLIGPTTSLK